MTNSFELPPIYWATIILISASIFTVLWILDAKMHDKIVGTEISEEELTTHRILIFTSMLMEASLLGMYFNRMVFLPIFIAAFITRTAHEFIDEIHFHTKRCTPRETFLHLGMWLSVITKTAAIFIWGFFSAYDGVLSLPIIYYIWGAVVFAAMAYTSKIEWNQGK